MTHPDSLRSRRCDPATLGACSSAKPQTPAAAPTAEATTAAPTQSATPASVPTVPGYRPSEIPPIPLFSVPAIDVLASNADKDVVQAASTSLASVPGVTVSPHQVRRHCDRQGRPEG